MTTRPPASSPSIPTTRATAIRRRVRRRRRRRRLRVDRGLPRVDRGARSALRPRGGGRRGGGRGAARRGAGLGGPAARRVVPRDGAAPLCGALRVAARARALLEAGAPVELRDGAGRTALALAVRSAGMREGRTDDDGVQQATMMEIASDLIACGASWASALDGEPPLDTAERDELRAWVARDDADGAAWRRVLAADGGGDGDDDASWAAADAAAEVARRVGGAVRRAARPSGGAGAGDALGARERRWAALEGAAAAAAARAVEGAATRARSHRSSLGSSSVRRGSRPPRAARGCGRSCAPSAR